MKLQKRQISNNKTQRFCEMSITEKLNPNLKGVNN